MSYSFPVLSIDPTNITVSKRDGTLKTKDDTGIIQARYAFNLDKSIWKVEYSLLEDEDWQLIKAFELIVQEIEFFAWSDSFALIYSPIWVAHTLYTVGSIVVPTTRNNRSYRSVVEGSSSSYEPTWPTTDFSSVDDGNTTWIENTRDVRFSEFTFSTVPPYYHSVSFILSEV